VGGGQRASSAAALPSGERSPSTQHEACIRQDKTRGGRVLIGSGLAPPQSRPTGSCYHKPTGDCLASGDHTQDSGGDDDETDEFKFGLFLIRLCDLVRASSGRNGLICRPPGRGGCLGGPSTMWGGRVVRGGPRVTPRPVLAVRACVSPGPLWRTCVLVGGRQRQWDARRRGCSSAPPSRRRRRSHSVSAN
jgi:hypothetical protein